MTKRVLVIGGADCVWDDMADAENLADFDALIAVNDAGIEYFGVVDIWATLHPEKLPGWLKRRDELGFSVPRLVYAHEGNTTETRPSKPRIDKITDYRFPGMSASGSSGLFAVKVAMEEGFDRIVLCGVPMQAERAHFFDKGPWKDVKSFSDAWLIALPHIRNTTRSMSGWTKELLGAPTPSWLAGGDR